MEQFIYKAPNGEQITFDYKNDFLIDSYDGLTAAEIEPITIKGYQQQGYSLGSLTFGARHINLNFLMTAKDITSLYEKRMRLARVFNPLLGLGELTYTNNYTTKSIRCYASTLPTPVERYGLAVMMNLELRCDNPFWYDTEENVVNLRGYYGGLKFPLRFNQPVKFADIGAKGTIKITGDVPSPIKAVFTAYENTTSNPILTKENTGEFIKINQTSISPVEKLIITTDYGNKNVIKEYEDGHQESAYHLIDVNSSFFTLEQGNNVLSFGAESGKPLVTIIWRNYYVGV